jgi:hypothetical protein
VIRAAVAVTPVLAGWWTLRAKLTDGAEVTVMTVGRFRVVA